MDPSQSSAEVAALSYASAFEPMPGSSVLPPPESPQLPAYVPASLTQSPTKDTPPLPPASPNDAANDDRTSSLADDVSPRDFSDDLRKIRRLLKPNGRGSPTWEAEILSSGAKVRGPEGHPSLRSRVLTLVITQSGYHEMLALLHRFVWRCGEGPAETSVASAIAHTHLGNAESPHPSVPRIRLHGRRSLVGSAVPQERQHSRSS